ncbi:MAG: sigma 54-interacting transcriptional regulator, partial [Desulfocapsaceae bacterium]|nr:sigma 54-interacting transcriptional regulator [Desulfocapsaceae bacterium]
MEKSPVMPHILESITDGLFTVDHSYRVMSFNRAAEKITGIPRKEALARKCWDVLRSNLCGDDCPLQKTMRDGQPFINIPAYITTKANKQIPVSISTALLHGDQGEVLGGVETFRDNSIAVSKRKKMDSCYRQGEMVSRSHLMNKIFTLLPKIAESDSTVLIEGDTGTGKEVLARAIHNLSSRRDKPFIAIN